MTVDGIQANLDELAERWGQVYVAYYPERPENGCIVRNTTDEGLPVGVDRVRARGNTFEEALEKAVDGDYSEP